jgi:hypothetical protein
MLVTRQKAAPAKAVTPAKTQGRAAVKAATKTVAKPEVEIPTAPRRLRVTSSNTAMETARMVMRAKAAIEEQLKVISKSEEEIDVAKAGIDQANKVIEAQLKLADLTHHTDGVYLAEIVEQWTNQSRNIDPQKFKNKVTNEVFWASIEVSLTKAKTHLTEKELNEIADVVPSQFKGRALKVKKLGPQKRTPKG